MEQGALPWRATSFSDEDSGLKMEDDRAYGGYLPSSILHLRLVIASWCNSSMSGFDPVGPGANPGEVAKQFRSVVK